MTLGSIPTLSLVLGIATEDAGGGEVAVRVSEDLVIRDAGDEVVFENEFDIEQNFPEDFPTETFFLVNNMNLPMGAGKGDYEAEITLHDEVADNSTSATAAFSLQA